MHSKKQSRIATQIKWLGIGAPLRSLAVSFAHLFFTILASILVARSLSPADRGTLQVVVFWPTLLLSFLQLSANEVTAYRRALISTLEASAAYASEEALSFTFTFFLAILATTLSVVLCPLLISTNTEKHAATAVMFTALYIPTTFLSLYMMAVTQGTKNFLALDILRLAQPSIYVAVIFVTYAIGRLDVQIVLFATITSVATQAALGLKWVKIQFAALTKKEVQLRLALARRLHTANMVTYVGNELDKILIITGNTLDAIGQWAVASTLAAISYGTVGHTLSLLTIPLISGAKTEAERNDATLFVVGLACAMAIFLNAVLYFILPVAVRIIIGDAFAPAGEIGRTLLLGTTAKTARYVLDRAMRARLNTRVGIQGELAFAASFVALIAMVEEFREINGVALAFGYAQLAALAATIYGYRSAVRKQFQL